ncbi:aldo/keto reductase [Paenibacillus dendritiformis]|uniref:aldo/keto reductase n=1 Tax=Paenibacillus dendritiformis TaxID=130049 RepID=UPI00143D0AFB|nr:aldo/keto reductase [Paenibacillus dendritiformis]NKI23845.1 aldo/keto reductase [Paenibacillus dendritiformis]NRF97078.1 aldo/keto reductase [Paenibacillus dendritiformis]
MHHQKLGSYRISAIGFGGAPLSVPGRPDREQAMSTIKEAWENGITFFDTADTYSLNEHDLGHNEQLFADTLPPAPGCIIATKSGLARPDGAWIRSGHPRSLRAACERSLLLLRRDAHPLYYLHAPDPDVPFEESFGELSRLQEEGKIEHLGLSNVSVAECEAALHIASVAAIQNRYHLFDRSSSDVLAFCESRRILFVAYSPFGGPGQSSRLQQDPLLQELASAYEASPYQIVLAWLLSRSPQLLPIPGATRPQSIRDSAQAVRLRLASEDLAKLDAHGTPSPGQGR